MFKTYELNYADKITLFNSLLLRWNYRLFWFEQDWFLNISNTIRWLWQFPWSKFVLWFAILYSMLLLMVFWW